MHEFDFWIVKRNLGMLGSSADLVSVLRSSRLGVEPCFRSSALSYSFADGTSGTGFFFLLLCSWTQLDEFRFLQEDFLPLPVMIYSLIWGLIQLRVPRRESRWL